MNIIIDKNNNITSFAGVGQLEGGIEIPNSILPDTFMMEFKSGKFKYENGTVSYNRDFSDNENNQLKSVNQSLEEKVKILEEKVKTLEGLLASLE